VTPPELDHRIVGQVLRSYLPTDPARRLVLVHGRYAATAPARFTVDFDGATRSVAVQDQHSVLGVAGAWQDHRDAGDEAVLVVTTGVPDRMLGWDVRGHALKRATLTVDRAEIVAQRFGAVEVEPRVRQEPWLLAALLDAEPTDGWPRTGPVLTHAAAVRALVGARFGFADSTPDAGVLLEWSRTSGPARFTALPEAEQEGLGRWLAESVGPFATLFTALVRAGRATDVLPLGVLASLLDEPGVDSRTLLAVGQLLAGVQIDDRTRAPFVSAVLGTLERWIAHAEGGGTGSEDARSHVLWVLDRADVLAGQVGLDASDHGFLPGGFDRRLADVARALTTEPDDTAVVVALGALDRLREHRIARLHPGRVDAAVMAVRLMRWLARSDDPHGSVAQAVAAHLRTGGWVDRALTAVWAGENSVAPSVGAAFGRVHDAARGRRDIADEQFAGRLKGWAVHASAAAPGGALLVEDVLEAVAVPLLAGDTAPLVVVVDGMSAAVATELGEQIAERGWTEISRDAAGREAAVAMIPSVTRVSRTSLLTGRPAVGDRTTERDGFSALWQRHRRGADLLHKADIAGAAGHRLSERLVTGLADGSTVVGVVLNTVDDALDHGREGDRTGWKLHDITYLPDLLDAARSYGRPVVLVSDHGHVLERSSKSPKAAAGPSARWRTGEPETGEVALQGPRVLEGDGRVVVPWREDIRYTNRKAGYHGGATLAEMTVPVLVFVPTGQEAPLGFTVLPREVTRPAWWNGHGLPVVVPTPVTPPTPARKKKPKDEAQGMLDDMPFDSAPTMSSLGAQLVASAVFKAQFKALRRAPEPPRVAALIDAMTAAGGELTATAAVAELGRAGRDPGPVLAHLQRLLNVEGYPVLSFDGRTVRLDVDVLHIQFGLGAR
jgi:hypothetical protein